jgi:hypothetical protein
VIRNLLKFIVLIVFVSPVAQAQPIKTMDLNGQSTSSGHIFRLLGSEGNGASGVPVAGGFDMDGDSFNDFAMASFLADPSSLNNAGQVYLVFGDGQIQGEIDTANANQSVLLITGSQVSEHAGSEIWMGEVTDDDLGDLIICRQDYSPPGRIGGGALTLIPGQPMLRQMAANNETLDLGNPPAGLQILNILGATTGSRLCIWARNGDITGDGIDDFIIGADRERSHGNTDAGAVYLVRGGEYLESAPTIDLADFGTVDNGNLARLIPPAVSTQFHFGATVQVADLDGNGKSEVLAAAALNRAGAALAPEGGSGNGSGGTPDGTLFIAWDDNFDNNWIPDAGGSLEVTIGVGTGSFTVIDGFAGKNDDFGEEILGGLDYDDDGNADLFVGDLTADGWASVTRNNAGTGHVIYNAQILKNLDFDLADSVLPTGFSMSTFVGPVSGAIGGDTAMHGDFNGDGIADLAFSSPHDNAFGRTNSGTIHVILGRSGVWPEFSDLAPANYPSSDDISIIEIYGAKGNGAANGAGDTLSYSGAFGDMNGDGVLDIITNEMQGDGSSPSAVDVGNLLLINIFLIDDTIFEGSFE